MPGACGLHRWAINPGNYFCRRHQRHRDALAKAIRRVEGVYDVFRVMS
ncbi:hypothetical protein ACF3NT_05520 [Naumannella halotolerans]|nr:hypothetical protein [Naumannella halotolerans]